MFGPEERKQANVEYRAETDGFVLVGGIHDGALPAGITEIAFLVGPKSPPTHKRITTAGFAGAGGTCPVRKGEYWQVAISKESPKEGVFVNWMPVE